MCDDTKVKAVHCFKLSSLLYICNHPLHFLQHEMLDDIYDEGNPIIWVFSPHKSQVPLPALGTCGEFCIPFSSTVEMVSDEGVNTTTEPLNLKPLFRRSKHA